MAPGSTRKLDTGGNRPLQVGDPAPQFELRHTFEKHVTLDDLTAMGPALVAFYVFDFGNI